MHLRLGIFPSYCIKVYELMEESMPACSVRALLETAGTSNAMVFAWQKRFSPYH